MIILVALAFALALSTNSSLMASKAFEIFIVDSVTSNIVSWMLLIQYGVATMLRGYRCLFLSIFNEMNQDALKTKRCMMMILVGTTS
mmetsp:Transcript_32768/g.60516  ORF Transcript_32768/g.60516 Transcript_32768/m.60516 type:complete len:87 (+) Transcript_32768:177-437(+)